MAKKICAEDGIRSTRSLGARIWERRLLYLMLVPMVVLLLIFSYYPMYGIILAFKEFRFDKGLLDSPWAKDYGFYNFIRLFKDPTFSNAMTNTLTISLGRLVFEFPMPIILALLINEIRAAKYKRVLQTVYTFPHFISWIIVTGLFFNLFANDGIVNQLFMAVGWQKQHVLSDPNTFRPLIFISSNWKEMGWSAIIYLATISGISPELYEAARIDGAGRWQLMKNITLPCLRGTIAILLILQIAGMMYAGFDQLFNLSNAAVRQSADIIDTLVYRKSFAEAANFGYTTAIGLFQSVVNFILLLIGNTITKKLNGRGIY